MKRLFLLILLMFLCYSHISYGAVMTPASSVTPYAAVMTPASSGTPSAAVMTPVSSNSPSAAEKKPDKSDKSTPVPEITPSLEELNLNYDSDEPNKAYHETTKESVVTSQSTGFLARILNMITSLGIVCLLVYVVLKLLYAKGAGIIPQPKKNLFVIEQVQLQPQKTLFLSLIKVGTRVLLVGATEKEITLLKEFEPEAFTLPDINASPEENKSAFKEEFGNITNRGQAGILSKIFQTFGLYGIASVFTRDTKNR